jgi:hypothetical protein
MGESTFSWVALRALARQDALTPFSDPDAHTLPMVSVHPALYRERIEASGVDHPSSLRGATSVAFNKVAYFCIPLVLRITSLCASMEFAFRALQYGRFKGRPPLFSGLP